MHLGSEAMHRHAPAGATGCMLVLVVIQLRVHAWHTHTRLLRAPYEGTPGYAASCPQSPTLPSCLWAPTRSWLPSSAGRGLHATRARAQRLLAGHSDHVRGGHAGCGQAEGGPGRGASAESLAGNAEVLHPVKCSISSKIALLRRGRSQRVLRRVQWSPWHNSRVGLRRVCSLAALQVGCGSNEYVGLLRRRVAERLGVDPACVRLFVGGAPGL